jgi:hypothetical protein
MARTVKESAGLFELMALCAAGGRNVKPSAVVFFSTSFIY